MQRKSEIFTHILGYQIWAVTISYLIYEPQNLKSINLKSIPKALLFRGNEIVDPFFEYPYGIFVAH